MQQVMELPSKGIVCLHSIIKQNDLITPENRLYDDRSAATAMKLYSMIINALLIAKFLHICN